MNAASKVARFALSRREFLKATTAVGAGLTVEF